MRFMEFSQPLTEGIKLKSPQEIYAYAVVVAEAYDAAPMSQPEAVKAFKVLNQSIQKMYKRMKSDVNVKATPDDPYGSPEDIGADVVKNKNLDVYSGDTDHPVLSPDQNVDFRAVHDYFAHIGPNRKNVGKGKFQTHNFTLRGEYNAYLTHTKLAPRETIPVLFTEVVGQVSSFHILQEFPEQKAVILPGFDYINIGVFTDEQKTARWREVKKMIESDQVSSIPVNVRGGIQIDKSKIKWAEIAKSGSRK